MAGGRGVGKRLRQYVDWLVTTEDPEAFGLAKLDELEREAAEEELEPPDRGAIVAGWRDLGWPGLPEPLHEALFRFARAERILGPAFVHGPAGPLVRWRFGSWQLTAHRAEVSRALRHEDLISELERRAQDR